MYNLYRRYYSDEGLLVFKIRNAFGTYEEARSFLDRVVPSRVNLFACGFRKEKLTHYDVYGPVDVQCTLRPENIQLRYEGKLIPWRNV